MELIKEIIIPNPPTYYDKNSKKKDKASRYYLTANLFFNNNTHFAVISKIVLDMKLFLREYMRGIPQLQKMSLEIEYRSTKHIDLDNKAYFWKKLFLDILKTPTQRQLDNAREKNRVIVTTNTIKDDTTEYVVSNSEKWVRGEHALIFRIYGIPKDEQKTLF